MIERLNLGQIALLITYAAGMAAGQLLFKAAALRLGDGHPLSTRALLLLQTHRLSAPSCSMRRCPSCGSGF